MLDTLLSLSLLPVTAAIGFAARRTGYLPEAVFEALPALLFKLCYPLLILNSVISVDLTGLTRDGALVIAVTACCTLCFFTLGRFLLRRAPEERRPLYLFNVAVGNLVYVTLPIISLFFGARGVVLATLSSSTQDVFIWSIFLAEFRRGEQKRGLRVFANPCFFALIAGVALALCGLRIPESFTAVSRIASMTTPLGMLYLGSVLARFTDRRAAQGVSLDGSVAAACLVKCAAVPLFCGGVMWLVSRSLSLSLLFALIFASPASLMSVVWARQFQKDERYAASVVLWSTVLFFSELLLFVLCGGTALL